MKNTWKLSLLLLLVILSINLWLGCGLEGSISRAESAVIISGGIADCSARIFNIRDFGAKGDGVIDDSQAVQKAADYARDNNGSLFIPAGKYLLLERVRFYTSVDCQGTFIMLNGNNDSSIVVSRWGKLLKIPADTLSGLTRGLTLINGLKGYAGSTVIIKSAEELIVREQWGSDYNKEDTVKIIDNKGTISPALDCTYNDMSSLTVTVYPDEKPIVISGLKVEAVGDAMGNSHLVYCVRSNVTFENPSIINTSGQGTAGCGLHIYDSVNVNVINPVIANFNPPGGDGYGIALGTTADISIFNGQITDCSNHAVTGRQDKNVLIKGGLYEGGNSPLDDHWGNTFKAEDAVLKGDIGITYAGTNIGIENCVFRDCIIVLAVRTDTPVLMGNVSMTDITASVKKDYKTLCCYNAVSPVSEVPDKVSVNNMTASIPGDGFLRYYDINPANRSDYAGKMIFTNIKTEGGTGTIITN